jgi:putative transposase
MRAPYTKLYVHLVWATYRRLALIRPELRKDIYAAIQHRCKMLKVELLAIGGMEDHIHVLVRFPATLSIADLVGRLKGASSHLVTQVIRSEYPFKWQGGYGAFTVSKRALPAVRDYILNQEEHHRSGNLMKALEKTEE